MAVSDLSMRVKQNKTKQNKTKQNKKQVTPPSQRMPGLLLQHDHETTKQSGSMDVCMYVCMCVNVCGWMCNQRPHSNFKKGKSEQA
jgi:hypothetical protein